MLKSSGAAVVEISEIKRRKPLDMVVGVSNFETAYAMTMHLVANGYKRIGFCLEHRFTATTAYGNAGSGHYAALSKT